MRRLTGTMLGLLAVAAIGCSDQLAVENTNQPDVERALARPTDVENLVANQFRVVNQALWNVTNLQAQMAVMGMESFSTNANFGMGVRSGVPRSLIDNSRGNPAGFFGTFQTLNSAARASALGLNRLTRSDFTFFPTSEAQRQRARAFGFFVKGVALGYLALSFDSQAVITPDDDLALENPLVGYDSLMRFALADLDSAIAIASISPTPAGGNGFPLPTNWVNGVTTLTGGATGNFVRLVRSYKARFRAGVARTPAERAAVDWASVIADANAGVTADVMVAYSTAIPWSYRPMQMDLFQSWHQMWQGFMGMADTNTVAASFDGWLNTPRANKAPFTVVTSDLRFPQGADDAAQRTSAGCTLTACIQPAATAPRPYFRNRPSGETVGVDGLFHSKYDFYRFQAFFNAARISPPNLPIFTVTELNLLAAEGYIRTNDFANAMTRINLSRTASGLPALAGIASINDLIADAPGARCVPRVPVGPTSALAETPTATACGNIMEAMKWEKRLETAFISMGGWYFDGRGWGDLPFNTPVQYPVPFTELDAREQPIYHQPSSVAGAATFTAAERLSNSSSNYGYGVP